jgi:hypothetical protein
VQRGNRALCPHERAGLQEVPGQRGRAAVHAFEHVRGPDVQPPPTLNGQLRQQRVPHEVVPERDPVGVAIRADSNQVRMLGGLDGVERGVPSSPATSAAHATSASRPSTATACSSRRAGSGNRSNRWPSTTRTVAGTSPRAPSTR